MYIDEYTDEVKKHFLNPHNAGSIKPDELKEGELLVTGTVGNPACGDLLTMYLKVQDNVILDCKVETFGCASAIACSSITTDMAKGKTIEEAKQISKKDAADALGGLPPIKMHCSNLAAEALHKAIDNYEKGVETVTKDTAAPAAETTQPPKPQNGAITKDMAIGDIIQAKPEAAEIMMRHGLHCIGCHVATWESLEQGALAHGLAPEKVEAMVKEINTLK